MSDKLNVSIHGIKHSDTLLQLLMQLVAKHTELLKMNSINFRVIFKGEDNKPPQTIYLKKRGEALHIYDDEFKVEACYLVPYLNYEYINNIEALSVDKKFERYNKLENGKELFLRTLIRSKEV